MPKITEYVPAITSFHSQMARMHNTNVSNVKGLLEVIEQAQQALADVGLSNFKQMRDAINVDILDAGKKATALANINAIETMWPALQAFKMLEASYNPATATLTEFNDMMVAIRDVYLVAYNSRNLTGQV